MLGTESLDGPYTHWTWGNGHKPPGQKSPRQKSPRPKVPPDKIPPGKKSPGQKTPRTKIPPAPDTQQVATYSIAAVEGNWTILVLDCGGLIYFKPPLRHNRRRRRIFSLLATIAEKIG